MAVIGCGAIAHEHLAFLSQSPVVELAAVCDRSAATAEFARQRFAANASFTDAATMLDSVRPDVVHVLTPPASHVQVITACLDAGAHVICEKPLTPTGEETAAILEHARQKGKTLTESRNLMFNDGIIKLRSLIDAGELGDVREVDVLLSLDLNESNFGDLNLTGPGVDLPGGAVHDFLPHLCYLFLELSGSPNATIAGGRLENLAGNPRVGFDHLDALVAAGPTRGRLRIASDLKPEMFRVVVRGTAGHAEIDLYHPYLRFQRKADSGKMAPFELIGTGFRFGLAGLRNLKDKVLQKGTYHGMPRMLSAIYQGIAGTGSLPIHEDQILATAHMVDEIVALGHNR